MTQPTSFLITGASSFLGKCLTRTLSQNPQYKVFLTSRTAFNPGDILKNGNCFHLSGIDLLKEEDLSVLSKAVDKFFPERFHLINCLGYFPGYRTMAELPIDKTKEVFDSNVISLYSVAHQLIPLMCKRGGGHFMAFSSHTNYQHYPRLVAYSAAKAAVESLISGISNEYLNEGIIANTIALSTLYTETERKLKPNGDCENWLQPEEVSRFIEEFVLRSGGTVNGNVIHMYKYSPSYFHQSYYQRIRQ
ncbi:MAG TPA: SDR family oxidoreductase [Puia sp.]|nr:SDR family oxidoreductase [Puia sp.]